MAFNFGSLATTQAVSTNRAMLKPWGIYTVKFKGAEKRELPNKSNPDNPWKLLDFKFENESGYYTESIFYPTEESNKRNKYERPDKSSYETPSQFENMMTLIAQIVNAVSPEGFKKLQEISPKIKSFDEMATYIIKLTEKAIDKETNIKLVGRTLTSGERAGSVLPRSPRVVALNKQGEVFTCDNFIGENLHFSDYEEGKRNEYLNTVPTSNVENKMNDVVAPAEVKDPQPDVDFDELLGDLKL